MWRAPRACRAQLRQLEPQSTFLDSPDAGTAEEYVPVEVEVCAADSRVPADEHARVRIVKVDVEGYEVEALRGVEGILAVGAR